MKVIYPHSIEKAIEVVDARFPEELEVLMNEFAEKQPVLMSYLMESSKSQINDEEVMQDFIYLSLVTWQAFLIQEKKMLRVPAKIIHEIEARSIKKMEEVQKISKQKMGEEEMLQLALSFMSDMNQPHLMEYLSLNLNPEEDNLSNPLEDLGNMFSLNPKLAEEDPEVAIAFGILKMEVDCLDEIINKPPLRIVR